MRRLLTLPILTPLSSDLSDAEIFSFSHGFEFFKCAHSFLCTFSIVFLLFNDQINKYLFISLFGFSENKISCTEIIFKLVLQEYFLLLSLSLGLWP